MKKIHQQLLLTVALLLCSIGIANAEIMSGRCGKNVTYKLDTQTGKLEINGMGSMYDWNWDSDVPWYSYSYSIKEVTISDDVTSIGIYAFSGCSGLTSVTIGNSVTSIGNFAFERCSGLTSVTIPNSVTSIGNTAFYGCKGLTSVTIPNSVTSIGKYAFYGCSGLTSVTIPNSVTSIGNFAFQGCSGLTSVTIPNSVTSIGIWAFYGCKGLTSVTIPNSVTSIGESAFDGCSGLTSVTIPNSVTSIEYCAFYGCSGLTSVTIGNSVTSIGNYAFSGCSEISDVYCTAEKVPSMGSDVFKNSYVEYCTLHVPSVSVNAYKSAEQWKNFGKIVAIEGGTPTYEMCIKPTITYTNGMISCTSETVGAVCHYTYTITPTVVSGEGTDSGSPKSVGGKIEVTAYATAEGYEASEKVTETFDYVPTGSGLKGDVNGDGAVTMQDANEVVNIYLGGK